MHKPSGQGDAEAIEIKTVGEIRLLELGFQRPGDMFDAWVAHLKLRRECHGAGIDAKIFGGALDKSGAQGDSQDAAIGVVFPFAVEPGWNEIGVAMRLNAAMRVAIAAAGG